MPNITPKLDEKPTYRLRVGPAAGNVSDFCALCYCPEADEAEKDTNPDHLQFTYLVRFQLSERALIARVPRRIDAIWQKRDGSWLAVGEGLGYLQITAQGVSEVALHGVPGIFKALWGFDDDHIFAAGVAPGFVFYRKRQQWLQLTLPDGTRDVRDVCGLSERDVYFVGEAGQVHHFDGQRVTRLSLPERRHLNAIVRLDDTRLCIGGYQGTLLVGNRNGFRHLVTNVRDPLLSLGVLDDHVYFGADEKVWRSDGLMPPQPTIDFAAHWVSGLSDALVLSNDDEAKLFWNGKLTDLPLTI